MKNTITVELVSSNGALDESASKAAFNAAYAAYAAEHETQESVISDAVNGIFDAHVGQNIKMGTLCHLALTALNVQNENFTALEARVKSFIRSQTKAGVFSMVKGAGGGFARVADAK
jgi:hypothetical protein